MGCGPGDPDLITVKAKKLIQKADVVVYSGSLIPSEILKLCKKARTYDAAKLVREEIFDLLKKNAKIDGVIACAHHPYAKGRFQHQNHPCRKPNGGMFLIAKKLFNLDLENSWMIGDKINDLKAAFSKGLKGGFLVMTGYGKEEEEKLSQVPRKNFIVKIASSINKVKIIF